MSDDIDIQGVRENIDRLREEAHRTHVVPEPDHCVICFNGWIDAQAAANQEGED